MNEPRRLPRVPFHYRVRVGVPEEGPQRLWAVNLSSGGMFIRAETPCPAGTELTVALETREGALPLGQAQVVWTSPQAPGNHSGGFGVKFIRLSTSARAMVETFIRHGGVSERSRAITVPELDTEAPTDPGVPPNLGDA